MDAEGVVIAADGELCLRAMRDADDDWTRLVTWRNRPHVRAWWDPDDPPYTLERARADCGPALRGEDPDRLAVIEVAGAAVGFVQFYPWAPYRHELELMDVDLPEGAWSLDILIGEPEWLDRGVGSRTVRLLCDHMLHREGASCVAFGVDRDNARARAAYLRAGMVAAGEYLDLDTRGGERVWSVLMVRTP